VQNRIKQVRKALNLNQAEFGERIGVKQSTVTAYECGNRTPLDAVIAMICKTFNVNETWLRTGEGEMFAPVDPENQLMEWAGRVLADSSDSFRARFVRMMMGLTDKEWAVLEEKARQLLDEEKDDS
jgi:transcriptional regulator with XRE-family HTH domain